MKRFWIMVLFLLLAGTTQGQIHKAFHPDPEATVKIACDAVMNDILGAALLYNISNPEMITDLGDKDLDEGGVLRAQGYLKKPVVKPTPRCSYSSVGDLMGKGYITCAVHGQARPTTESSMFREFEKKAEVLLFYGADINEYNEKGLAPIHVAVDMGSPLILEYLIAKGANLNLPDDLGRTARRRAREAQKLELARILANHGGTEDPNESVTTRTVSAGSVPLEKDVRPADPARSGGEPRPTFTSKDMDEHGKRVIFWDNVQGALGKSRQVLKDLSVFDSPSSLIDSVVSEKKRAAIREIALRLEKARKVLEVDFERYGNREFKDEEVLSQAKKHLDELTKEFREGTSSVEAIILSIQGMGLKTQQYVDYLVKSWEGPFYLPDQPNDEGQGSAVYAGSVNELKALINTRLDMFPKLIADRRNLLRLGDLFSGNERHLNFTPSALEEMEELFREADTLPVRLKMTLERLSVRGVLSRREVDEARAKVGLLNQEGIKLDFKLGGLLEKEFARMGIKDNRVTNDVCFLVYDGKFGEAARVIRESATGR